MAEREVSNDELPVNEKRVVFTDNVYQYFQCLKSISGKPICCKFVLEYPGEVQLPNNIEKELNREFELYLTHDQGGCDGSGPVRSSSSIGTEGNNDSSIPKTSNNKVRAWLHYTGRCS